MSCDTWAFLSNAASFSSRSFSRKTRSSAVIVRSDSRISRKCASSRRREELFDCSSSKDVRRFANSLVVAVSSLVVFSSFDLRWAICFEEVTCTLFNSSSYRLRRETSVFRYSTSAVASFK
ncbi:hypothetical protein X777_07932 [Ooceraea biroi]|uniref:Uncharacterized protein n=1 Tax=Ooceraea biroi TaxID=2015173 RepID=A0A026X2L6_OOCBI|nr:hypothetical protein X777_07932 [Ooceraea biroi]